MIRGEIAGDYRQLNPRDRAAFQRWMLVYTVAGAVAVMALIAVTSVGYSGKSGSRTANAINPPGASSSGARR